MKIGNNAYRILVNLCRVVLGIVLVLSGFVKAIDPLGTQYKIDDYLLSFGLAQFVPHWITLAGSVILSGFEFCLGVFILIGIRRRLMSWVTLVFMLFMTAVTLWSTLTHSVTDCGCFGDALPMTPIQSLAKNVLLTLPAVVLVWKPRLQYRFMSESTRWIAVNFTILFILLTSLHCLYHLPLFDFRPYHIGANLAKGTEIPANAPQPQFETTFILEKNGERRTFSLDNYPDSSWTFIDSKTTLVRPGYEPPMADFMVSTIKGEDVTRLFTHARGYMFLLVAPYLDRADDSHFGDIDAIYEYAKQWNIPFYCLTAGDNASIRHWQDITGAEYPFYRADDVVLKTMIRSNPGLILLKDGTIIGKWGHNDLPQSKELSAPLAQLPLGQMPRQAVYTTLLQVLGLFFLPLILLVLADRLWSWSHIVRQEMKHKREQLEQLEEITLNNITNKNKKHEKENRSR